MPKNKLTSHCDAQVIMLNESLKTVDPSMPTYPLWTRLTAFLGSVCETLNDLQVAVRGDGNGTRGLLERMTVIEGSVKVTQSDIREMLNTMRQVYGHERDEMEKVFDESNHPKRRATDKEDMANKVLMYFINRILPQIIVWAIMGWLAFMIAVNQHLIVQGN